MPWYGSGSTFCVSGVPVAAVSHLRGLKSRSVIMKTVSSLPAAAFAMPSKRSSTPSPRRMTTMRSSLAPRRSFTSP